MGDFPLVIHPWADVTNEVDAIDATHMNTAHAEIIAIETILNKMQSIVEGWTIDRDLYDSSGAEYYDADEITILSGFVAISGTVAYLSGSYRISTANDFRDGESAQNNTLLNIYGYLSGTALKHELSVNSSDGTLRMAADNSRRWISCCRYGTGALQKYKQIGELFYIPTITLWGTANTWGYSAISLATYVPDNCYEALILFYITGNLSNYASIEFTTDTTNYPALFKFEDMALTSTKAMTHTFWMPIIGKQFYAKVNYGAYSGGYITAFRAKLRRD